MMMLATLLALAAQDVAPLPPVETPGELLRCGTDDSLQTVLCRATVAEGDGRYADSAEAFEQASRMIGDDETLRARTEIAAGNMWIAAKQPSKADAAFQRALAFEAGLDPVQRGLARLDRARAAAAMGEVPRARALLSEATPFVDGDPFLWYLRSVLALQEDDLGDARASIDRGLALAADAPEILLQAGHVALAEGQEGRAREHWADAARRSDHPSGRAAAEALVKLDEEPVTP